VQKEAPYVVVGCGEDAIAAREEDVAEHHEDGRQKYGARPRERTPRAPAAIAGVVVRVGPHRRRREHGTA